MRKKHAKPVPLKVTEEEAKAIRAQLMLDWPKGTRVQVNARGRLLNIRKHEGKTVQYTGTVTSYPRDVFAGYVVKVLFDGLMEHQNFAIEYLEKINAN